MWVLFIRTWHEWRENRETQTHQADTQTANLPTVTAKWKLKQNDGVSSRRKSYHDGFFMFKCNTIFITVLALFIGWFGVSVCVFECVFFLHVYLFAVQAMYVIAAQLGMRTSV